MRIRYASLFSGIECASVTFNPLGWNGMAVEVVRWIGQRIEKVEKIARRKRRGHS